LVKAGLPVKARGINPRKIYDAHLHDKKFTGGKNRFVLISGIGGAKVAEGVSEKLVKKAIAAVCAK
jgi:3-dehydroquinate synthetase